MKLACWGAEAQAAGVIDGAALSAPAQLAPSASAQLPQRDQAGSEVKRSLEQDLGAAEDASQGKRRWGYWERMLTILSMVPASRIQSSPREMSLSTG